MKKILTIILSLLSIFVLASCTDSYSIIDQEIDGTFEVTEGFTDATITLILDDEDVFLDKDIIIVVVETLNPINKYQQTFTKGKDDYIFDNLKEGTNYEVGLYLNKEVLNLRISYIDFKTQIKALEGELSFEGTSDTGMTVVVDLFEDTVLTTENVKVLLTGGSNVFSKDFIKGTTNYVFTGLVPSTEYTASLSYSSDLVNNVSEEKETTKDLGAIELKGSFIPGDKTQNSLEFSLLLNNVSGIKNPTLLTLELRDESNTLIGDPQDFVLSSFNSYNFVGLKAGTTYTAYVVSVDNELYSNIKLSATTEPLTTISVTGVITVDTALTTQNSITVTTSISDTLDGTTPTLEIKDYVTGIVLTSETKKYVDDSTPYVFNNLEPDTEYEIYFVVEDANEASNIDVIEGNETTKTNVVIVTGEFVLDDSVQSPDWGKVAYKLINGTNLDKVNSSNAVVFLHDIYSVTGYPELVLPYNGTSGVFDFLNLGGLYRLELFITDPTIVNEVAMSSKINVKSEIHNNIPDNQGTFQVEITQGSHTTDGINIELDFGLYASNGDMLKAMDDYTKIMITDSKGNEVNANIDFTNGIVDNLVGNKTTITVGTGVLIPGEEYEITMIGTTKEFYETVTIVSNVINFIF